MGVIRAVYLNFKARKKCEKSVEPNNLQDYESLEKKTNTEFEKINVETNISFKQIIGVVSGLCGIISLYHNRVTYPGKC